MYKSGVGVLVQSMRDVRVEDSWVKCLEERCLEEALSLASSLIIDEPWKKSTAEESG